MYPARTKFLVVDDHPTMRKVVKEILLEMGYNNVVEAVDGSTALNIIKGHAETAEPVGFIISDWNMPVMTGIELLKECRNSPHFKNLPFILLTGEREQHQIIEAAKSGVSDYIIKPFSAVKIKDKIEKIYQKHNSSSDKKVA